MQKTNKRKEDSNVRNTPSWEKIAILISALAALIAALVSIYQGYHLRRTIQIDLSASRPFLTIEPHDSKLTGTPVLLEIKNTGHIPARILYRKGKTWIAGKETRTGIEDREAFVVYPGKPVNVTQVNLDYPENIIKGQDSLRIRYCAVYQSIEPTDTRKWISETWLRYEPRSGRLEIEKRDEKNAGQYVDTCSIDVP